MATAKATAKNEVTVSENFHSARMEFVSEILKQKKIADPKSGDIIKAYKVCEKHLASMQDIATKEGKFQAWITKAERMMRNFDHNAEYKRVEKKLAKEQAKGEKAKEKAVVAPKVVAPKVVAKAEPK